MNIDLLKLNKQLICVTIGDIKGIGIHILLKEFKKGKINNFVLITNVKVSNFEVAGIAINTGKKITIENSHINGSSNKIRVLATFAMVQDLKNSLETILSLDKYNQYHELASKYLSNSLNTA